MRALVLHSPGDLRLEELDLPKPSRRWLKLAVRRVGVCGTDRALYTGDYRARKLPLVLGHEISGEVVELGEGVDESLLGSRVTTEINVSCNECWFCRSGVKEHCLRRETIGLSLDGGMADYVLTREDLVHSIEGLSWQQGAFVEPLAAALKPFTMRPPKLSSCIAVVGLGTIGLLSLQVAKIYEPERLVAVYRSESKRVELAERYGAETSKLGEVLELKREINGGAGFDLVIEATGSPDGLEEALSLVRARGTVFAKSTHGRRTLFDYTKAVVNEVSIIGSRCGPFRQAISLLKRGRVSVDELVTSVYPLEEGVEAIRRSFERDQVKVQIEV
ncbi:MAG: alcohol dehydrogenase catalytic domain-containing protein [Candidatus Korarchaeum sp.]|nr:alcohol dehydrogenase catalytic domain-containing protein [Candidatus Korarchaeum sp.]MDW8035132.1 alcohol dehydrogenase catalytic domain-containing protein [Candidatus Korarchaeum sp.]